MQNRVLRFAGLAPAVVLVVMMFVAPAYAASSFTSGWYTLGPGQTVEWDLSYPGNGNPSSNNTATLQVVEVPTGSVQFKVWTDAQWQQLAAGQSPTEIGDGTQMRDVNNNLLYNGNLIWQAGTPEAGFYHIQFTNTTQQNASYQVMLTGVGSITPYSTTMASQQTSNPAMTQPAMAQAGANPTAAQGAPTTLPVTGSNSSALLGLAVVGLALIAGGVFVKRRGTNEHKSVGILAGRAVRARQGQVPQQRVPSSVGGTLCRQMA